MGCGSAGRVTLVPTKPWSVPSTASKQACLSLQEAGRLLVLHHPQLHNKFRASLGYVSPSLKKKEKKKSWVKGI